MSKASNEIVLCQGCTNQLFGLGEKDKIMSILPSLIKYLGKHPEFKYHHHVPVNCGCRWHAWKYAKARQANDGILWGFWGRDDTRVLFKFTV